MARARVGVVEHGEKAFRHYVVPGETLVFTTHLHWSTLLEPFTTAVVSGVVVLWLMWELEQSVGDGVLVLGLLWLGVLGRALYHLLEWHDTWFASTSRRLLMQHGLITHKVAMMPLEKVTDMSFTRSATGQVLGYGKFVLESAGQDQALRTINFIPHSEEAYRLLVATMFATKGVVPAEEEPDGQDEDDELFDGDGGADGPGHYSIDEWEALQERIEAEENLDGDLPQPMPPSFPPRRPAAGPPPVGADAPTQVIDVDDPVTLHRDPWAEAYHPPLTPEPPDAS